MCKALTHTQQGEYKGVVLSIEDDPVAYLDIIATNEKSQYFNSLKAKKSLVRRYNIAYVKQELNTNGRN
jgi:hypothetical protein